MATVRSPFEAHLGIAADRASGPLMTGAEHLCNHIGSTHAGALFSIALAAVERAVADAHPGAALVDANHAISYDAVAAGGVDLIAEVDGPLPDADGAGVDVQTRVLDASGRCVATLRSTARLALPKNSV